MEIDQLLCIKCKACFEVCRYDRLAANVPFDQMLVTGSQGTGSTALAAGSAGIHAQYNIMPRRSLRGRRL